MAALEQYSQVIVSISMIAVLSRLLDSTAIGLAVIGLGIGTIAFNFREFVTSEYLIQREDVSEEDVRTGFTLIFGFSVAIGSLLILLAHWFAGFYSEAGLSAFVCVLAISGVIDAPVSTIAALLRRDMEFGNLTRINALGSIVNALVTIAFAWFGFGFMSFAWGTLASALVRIVLAFHARPIFWMFRPRLKGWYEFFIFGGYKGASTVLDRTYEALPQLVLGRIMPLTAVGLFNRANVVCGLPDKILLSAIFSVAFPAFAAEARAQRSVKDAYLKIISYITALYWPAVLVVAILAHPIVHVALGQAWDATVPLVQILSVAAIFWFPNILTFPVLVALGANREAFRANFIGRGMSIIVICTASFFGLYALVLSQFIALPFQMLISLIYVRRHAPFHWQELFAILAKSAVVTFGGILGPLGVLAANGFAFDLSILQALAAGLFSAIGWVTALVITKHPFLEELIRIVGLFLPRLLPSKQGVPAE
ncbi:oligosaccharide flippase family protein [Phyllobacterium bourgognense]|nr:oligosaccharide flippase family protein [Phyllobacterium bourgognense]